MERVKEGFSYKKFHPTQAAQGVPSPHHINRGNALHMPRTISLKTIQARIAELQKKAVALETKVKPGVDKAVALIKKHKLTLADLKHAFSGKAGRPAKGAKKSKRVSKLKGKKAPVKFKDAEGNKWTGRGRAPLWIVAAEKAGKNRSSFAVK